ncbi:high-affinity iron transporter [Paenibacillus sp. yr247]|uniref:FTR1 family iron permease n=1 Tax=Paenibacillus sp. yr247 TaxID=1761880 RepID=UPI00088A0714|nr:high-affinity iron transporter [Paenibacillus sp. yr247]
MKIPALFLLLILLFPSSLFADTASDDLQKVNDYIVKAINFAEQNDLIQSKEQYDKYNTDWYRIEEGIKKKSKGAYRSIEENMGEVQFAFAQKPTTKESVISSLKKLNETNQKMISGDLSSFKDPTSNGKTTIDDLIKLLDQVNSSLDKNDVQAAKEHIQTFRNSWLEIEGLVLSQSSKVYADAERDMVSSYALLTSNPPKVVDAKQTVLNMRDYLIPLSSKTSYTMVDVITILLREGLEALLVIVALLGYLNKSGHGEKKNWLWFGIGAGVFVSVVIGIVVQLLFSSGTFGNNNFLIAGCTGLFAAVMLIYMSYWLHSKSSIASWNQYINNKSTQALATGSLWSIAILAFLAVFREGTETVLFFIGMASSISLATLLTGIMIGLLILGALAFLILKVGIKIPMRPFFLISSILVYYLCFKFLGMGIHGLQLAGILSANHTYALPTVEFLGLYPTWENIIPQGVLLLAAVVVVVWKRLREQKLQHKIIIN